MKAILSGSKNWKKVLESIAQKAETLRVGVLEGAKTEDGESVAPYAFYNEFGATVEVPERTQTLYFKRRRGGTVGNRFVRKDKSDFAQDGDMFFRPEDGTWWLVVAVVEDFSSVGWSRVRWTLQVNGPEGVEPPGAGGGTEGEGA